MTDDTLLPFDLPAVHSKKITADFDGGTQSSDRGLLPLREAERILRSPGMVICEPPGVIDAKGIAKGPGP